MWAGIPIVGELLGKFLGYKSDQEANRHTETIAPYNEFSAEFRQLTKRTWWDSFIDGLNRLPRPTIVSLVIGYFLTSWMDPEQFAVINAGLATVPSPMWYVLSAIIGFYFAARELHKFRTEGRSTFESAVRSAKELAELKANSVHDSVQKNVPELAHKADAIRQKIEQDNPVDQQINDIFDNEDSA